MFLWMGGPGLDLPIQMSSSVEQMSGNRHLSERLSAVLLDCVCMYTI